MGCINSKSIESNDIVPVKTHKYNKDELCDGDTLNKKHIVVNGCTHLKKHLAVTCPIKRPSLSGLETCPTCLGLTVIAHQGIMCPSDHKNHKGKQYPPHTLGYCPVEGNELYCQNFLNEK